MQRDFRNLKRGDRIRIKYLDDRSFTGDNSDEKETNEITVSRTYNTHNFGPVLEGTGEDEIFYSEDELEIEILEFANKLPDADYFVWVDADHEEHVAIRYGHPANGVWKYDRMRYSTENLLLILNGAKPKPLVLR